MVSDEALKKLQEQIAAWPMERRFVVQQLIRDYLRNREDLRAYEATGLTPEDITAAVSIPMFVKVASAVLGTTPERLRELAEADKDGRLVVPPCKVGDTAFWVHSTVITKCRVNRIQVNRNGLYVCLKSTVSHGAFRTDLCLGKTVFLTREEAEKALEGMTC